MAAKVTRSSKKALNNPKKQENDLKRILPAIALAVTLLASGPASAHQFWIKLTESLNHPPGHVLSALGFGHELPLDDYLVGSYGSIQIGKYQVVGPDGKAADLGLPEIKQLPTNETKLGLDVTSGDLGIRKIALKEGTPEGAYQVAAESVPMFFTTYVNDKGKNRVKPLPMDAIKDLKTVKASYKYQSFAKSYFAVGKWTEPKPLGHELELTPLTDMSKVRAGDIVEFNLTFKGKPVTTDSNNLRVLTATSNTFGGPDKFFLAAMVFDGKAQFRIPTAGQWVVNIYYIEKVEDNPALKELEGKCTLVYTAASVFFTVKP